MTAQKIRKGTEMEKQSTALALPDEDSFRKDMQAIIRFQAIAKANMIEGHDYGVIPGTNKPTLLKPGAEKIAKLLGLADEYDILLSQEDWERPLFNYQVKCRLVNVKSGNTISEGLGECNSMEAKYRWREASRKCPNCGSEAIIKGKEEYGGGWLCFSKKGGCGAKFNDGDLAIEDQKIGRVPNDDVYSQVNTILKMAKKRALVDASLSAGRLSDLFTQDIEDIHIDGQVVNSKSGEIFPASEKPWSDTPLPTHSTQPIPTHGGSPSTDNANPLATCNPSTAQWNVFWGLARNLGFDKADTHRALEIVSVKDDWLPKGKTLLQAIDVLQGIVDKAIGPDQD